MLVSSKSQQTHLHILDAALRCYQEHGIDQVNMSDIAKAANIGRTTLYRHFKSQSELTNQLLIRDIASGFHQLKQLLNELHSLEEKMVESLLFCIDNFQHKPALVLALRTPKHKLFQELGISAEEIQLSAKLLIQPIYQQAAIENRLRPGTKLDDFIDWNIRILRSFLNDPGRFQHEKVDLRHFLYTFYLPSVLNDKP